MYVHDMFVVSYLAMKIFVNGSLVVVLFSHSFHMFSLLIQILPLHGNSQVYVAHCFIVVSLMRVCELICYFNFPLILIGTSSNGTTR
jgi:hypothetical protein